jgi:hypothetical protein
MKAEIKIILAFVLAMFCSCNEIPPEIKYDKYDGRDEIRLVAWGYYNENDLHKCEITFRSDSLDLVFQITYSMPIEATHLPFGTWTIANNKEYSNFMLSDTVSGWQCVFIENPPFDKWDYFQILNGKLTITENYVDLDIDRVSKQSYKNLKFRAFEVMERIWYSR